VPHGGFVVFGHLTRTVHTARRMAARVMNPGAATIPQSQGREFLGLFECGARSVKEVDSGFESRPVRRAAVQMEQASQVMQNNLVAAQQRGEAQPRVREDPLGVPVAVTGKRLLFVENDTVICAVDAETGEREVIEFGPVLPCRGGAHTSSWCATAEPWSRSTRGARTS